MVDANSHETEPNVLDLIAGLKKKTVAGKGLSPETRREVVEYLAAEGVSAAEASRLLGVAARTVRRDLERIREANALKADPGMADRVAGELMNEARAAVARIRRVTREKDAPHGARIEGEKAAYQILDQLASRLQSLGHLPTASQKVQADLTHHLGETRGLDELREEVDRIAQIVPEDAPQSAELRELGRITQKASSLDSMTNDRENDPGQNGGINNDYEQ